MSGEKDLLVRTMYENGFYSMVSRISVWYYMGPAEH